MMSGEGEGEVSAGWRGAATEASRPLKETLLLLTLLLSEVVLVLKHLRTISAHINMLWGHRASFLMWETTTRLDTWRFLVKTDGSLTSLK